MIEEPAARRIDRRTFLRQSGMAAAGVAGAAAYLPPLGWAQRGSGSPAPGLDPDQLFASGRFADADAGYRRMLAGNPDDAHALAQRGYIALLSNKFADAEQFLTRAIQLSPDDIASKARLADCFVRQDDFTRAVPLLRASGNEARALQYASATGRPYDVRGDETARLPFLTIDPLPVIEVSANGLPPVPLFLDTGAQLGFSSELAARAGVREVASSEARQGARAITLHLGIVDSLQLGGIEVRNVPVSWFDGAARPRLPDGSQPSGGIGTTILYHFLSTMDYANRALILRQKTPEHLHAFQAEAGAAGAAAMPFWMAPTHFLLARGSLNGHGPMLFSLDTGGPGLGVVTSEAVAEQVGFTPNYAQPRMFVGTQVFPFTADQVALGAVVRRNMPGVAGPLGLEHTEVGFEAAANITHEFFKPFAITFDFVDMTSYIAGDSPDATS